MRVLYCFLQGFWRISAQEQRLLGGPENDEANSFFEQILLRCVAILVHFRPQGVVGFGTQNGSIFRTFLNLSDLTNVCLVLFFERLP